MGCSPLPRPFPGANGTHHKSITALCQTLTSCVSFRTPLAVFSMSCWCLLLVVGWGYEQARGRKSRLICPPCCHVHDALLCPVIPNGVKTIFRVLERFGVDALVSLFHIYGDGEQKLLQESWGYCVPVYIYIYNFFGSHL